MKLLDRKRSGALAVLVLSVVASAMMLGTTKVAAVGATLVVDDDGVQCPAAGFITIQAAVAAASPGDTIQVCAGTYSVVGATIDKSLTLMGAQAGVDARTGRPGAQESIISGSGFGTFHLSAANITFDGFTFSNLKSRELDSTTNADNFTMRNCILQGSAIEAGSPLYQSGAIQFGGGAGLHANNLVFEQNLVTADNGNLLYMGHAMDSGTIRNNVFHGDTVAFGPFGNRTGWVITGNDFNGDVPGHGPYWGFAFNANLGDVIISNNNVHKMLLGIGQISVVGGSITGNTFDDNKFAAFQLWGGEFGSVVSTNVVIQNNLIRYNGAADDSPAPGDKSHGIRLRPGLDASTIHIQRTNFTNLGVGTGWAIRQNGDGTADATFNWWGQGTGPAVGQNDGLVNTNPYIASYTDDPAHAGQLGFWPLVTTETTITGDTPDPSAVNQAYTVSGTVEVTGLGGVSGNFGALPGQVEVSDPGNPCTDTSLTDSGPLNTYAFSCNVTSTTSGSKTLQAVYTDTIADSLFKTSTGTTAHNVEAASSITVQKTLDSGADPLTSFCFTLSPDPGIGQVCANGAGSAVFNFVPAGTYSATETSKPGGYIQLSNNCSGLSIVPGTNLSCQVHNAFPVTRIVHPTLGCPGASFTTIQAAVTAASEGDTIQVCAASYTENVSITKALNMKGAQAGVDARGRAASESIVNPSNTAVATFAIASNKLVTIDGFSFVGGAAATQGVIFTSVGPNNNMQIVNNRFSGYSTAAIWLNRGGSDMTIDQNVLDGSNIAAGSQAIFLNGPQSYNGLYLTNNNIINNKNRYGLFVDGTRNVSESATRAPLISGNLFDNNLQGMNLGRASLGTLGTPALGAYAATISGNTFSNNAFDGIQGGVQHVRIAQNQFLSNGRNGIGLSTAGVSAAADRGAQNSFITCNLFVGNGFTNAGGAVFLSSAQTAGTIGTNVVTDNSIKGNAFGLSYAGSESIAATVNWWGAASGPTTASNPGGTGDSIVNASSSVNYSPFLTSPSGCAPAQPSGTITVHKTVDSGGASPTLFCFTLSPDPGKGQVCANASGDAVFTLVPLGIYSAAETSKPAAYHEVSNTCAGLNIAAAGTSLTCQVHDAIGPPPAAATFVPPPDTTTQGNWKGPYGTNGFATANDATSYPAYATVSMGGFNSWTWSGSTADVRALRLANSPTGRQAATWYAASSFTIDVNLTDNSIHRIALYLLDWDNLGRAETIDVLDATSNSILDTRSATSFVNGAYLIWNVQGHVVFRITRDAGANAVVSGIFFDPASGAPPHTPPTVTLTQPTAATPFTAPATVNFNANVGTSDGATVTQVAYYAGASQVALWTPGPPAYQASWSPVAAGTYSLTAHATDSLGGTTTSAPVVITVSPGGGGGGPTASFVGPDAATQGNWPGTYGGDGYRIANDATSDPSYAAVAMAGQSAWTWAMPTTDVRALVRPANPNQRIASTFYSGTEFTIDVNITDAATHQVGLYLLDFDNIGRVETLDVLDGDTLAVLNTQPNVSGFAGGRYLVWSVTGHVKFRITRNAGANAVVSGVFFDTPLGSPVVPAATYVTNDAATKGNWIGTYGADGYNVVDDAVSYPAYAHVTTAGIADWTWAAATAEVRALKRATSPANRIAATLYDSTGFTIDINLVDGATHKVALYALDWDGAGRTETIEVLNAVSNAVLDSRSVTGFSDGQYLVWSVTGHVKIRVTRVAGPNAVVAGIFFGAP